MVHKINFRNGIVVLIRMQHSLLRPRELINLFQMKIYQRSAITSQFYKNKIPKLDSNLSCFKPSWFSLFFSRIIFLVFENDLFDLIRFLSRAQKKKIGGQKKSLKVTLHVCTMYKTSNYIANLVKL